MFEQQGTEEYFSTISSPARRIIKDVVEIRATDNEWDNLSCKEREKVLDERLIDIAAPKAQKYHTLDSKRRNKNKYNQQSVRLSTFGGVDQVFPRLKIDSGQKKQTVVDETDDSCQSFAYRDEHSAPFSWMTRSQQELRFESGTPDQLTEEELAEQGLEVLRTTSPATTTSSGSNRQSLQHIRQSRGNPCYAKPVQIPTVPSLVMSPTEPPAKPVSVSPHRINNFVCETSPNRLVLDFGDLNGTNGEPEDSASSSECSAKSSSTSGLLAKMKQKTKSSLKRSLSSVSNKNKHKNRSKDRSPTNSTLTTGSTISITHTSLSSLQSASTLTAPSLPSNGGSSARASMIVKPSYAPPPPPTTGHLTKPSCAPPPPPVRKTPSPPKEVHDANQPVENSIIKDSVEIPDSSKPESTVKRDEKPEAAEADGTSLEEFKIDLKVASDIPKTGFDFLDDW